MTLPPYTKLIPIQHYQVDNTVCAIEAQAKQWFGKEGNIPMERTILSPLPKITLIQRYQIDDTLYTKEEAADELRRRAIVQSINDWASRELGYTYKVETWGKIIDFILSERTSLREILGFTPDEIIANFSAGGEE